MEAHAPALPAVNTRPDRVQATMLDHPASIVPTAVNGAATPPKTPSLPSPLLGLVPLPGLSVPSIPSGLSGGGRSTRVGTTSFGAWQEAL